jgi:hypothetical protein
LAAIAIAAPTDKGAVNMPTCPICKKEAAALPTTGDADGYDCQSDGQFKVAGTLKALPKYAEASNTDW